MTRRRASSASLPETRLESIASLAYLSQKDSGLPKLYSDYCCCTLCHNHPHKKMDSPISVRSEDSIRLDRVMPEMDLGQTHENHPAKVILVHEPDMPIFMVFEDAFF
jgi:hypothetical protein